MSLSYTFTDPATGKTRFFYGYLYDCHVDAPYGCPYSMRLNDDHYCNHPNSHEYGCGSSRNRFSRGTG